MAGEPALTPSFAPTAGPRHRLYLSPGLFGFGRLATYVYFAHLERALKDAFERRGIELELHLVDVQPTASVRRRAQRLAELVSHTAGEGSDPIHLVGHSTGGLDARLVASPSYRLAAQKDGNWVSRLKSVSTLSTPHYGTPLATFFATVSGQKALYALSAFTIVALSLGAIPLSLLSTLGAAVLRSTSALGLELRALERASEGFLGLLGPSAYGEVSEYLKAIKEDQGGVIQLTPEAMDLFQAGVEDREGVRYQCTVAMVEPQKPTTFLRNLLNPTRVASMGLFAALNNITARYDERYPCAAPFAGVAAEERLVEVFGRSPGVRANDGIVPLRSQIWGDIAWAGYADHLDVLGHYGGGTAAVAVTPAPITGGAPAVVLHRDWLHSGAGMTDATFLLMIEALVAGMLA